MPFLGETESGNIVLPHQVDDGVVFCPSCNGEMTVRESYWNQGKHISRHFSHKQKRTDCTAESPTHQKMKAIAGSTLDDLFGFGEVLIEEQISKSHIADLVVEFDKSFIPLGKGIIVEVQHKNKGKELKEVTEAYLQEGYSVIWMWPSDFDFEDKAYSIPNDRIIPCWPNVMPELQCHQSYPKTHPSIRNPESEEVAGKVPATFPPIIKTIHQFDVESPVEGKRSPGWKRLERKEIHSVGHERLWVTIYGHEAIGSMLEFRWVDTTTSVDSEDWLPIPISPGDSEKVKLFCRKGPKIIKERSLSDKDGNWSELASIVLAYNAGLQGKISLGCTNQGFRFKITQVNELGTQRDVVFPYRKGDFERLSQIIPNIAGALPPQYPLKSSPERP